MLTSAYRTTSGWSSSATRSSIFWWASGFSIAIPTPRKASSPGYALTWCAQKAWPPLPARSTWAPCCAWARARQPAVVTTTWPTCAPPLRPWWEPCTSTRVWQRTREWVTRFLHERAEEIDAQRARKDAKSLLQEYTQASLTGHSDLSHCSRRGAGPRQGLYRPGIRGPTSLGRGNG